MAWPTNLPNTDNLDSATDNPALARADLKLLVDAVVDIIHARSVANGIASLDSSGRVPIGQLPAIDLNIPIGTILFTAGSTAPTGWAICDGSVIPSTDEFAALRTLLGARFALFADPQSIPRLPSVFIRTSRHVDIDPPYNNILPGIIKL